MTGLHSRILSLAVAAVIATPALAQKGGIPIVIETSLGTIEASLDSAHAPRTVVNILRYIDRHAYDGGRFHRAVRMDNQPASPVKIEVIQGGVAPDQKAKDDAPIALERTSVTGLHHLDGTLSMARGGPDSATSDFFVCIGAQPELDFGGKRNPDGQGFAAFGKVTKGMDVVRKIQAQHVEAQALTPPVTIVRIARRR
jgi:peptidyl-prolyl cis-trans isomerase A (cyclophilin A)